MRRAEYPTRFVLTAGFFVAVALVATGAAEAIASPLVPSSSAANKDEAIRSIPFDRMNAETQAKLAAVVTKPSIYRRMPVQMIDCDPDMYLFLVRYPEVVVNIWHLMGISNVSIRRTGAYTFEAADGAGTVSTVELMYGDADTHVLFAEGYYEGPLFARRITAKCVLVLKSGYARGPDERTFVSNRLDLFVHLDHAGADLLAKTLHPLVGRAADHNFTESTTFLSRVSQAAERNGPGVQQMAARLTQIDPAVRTLFADQAGAVHQKAAMRQVATLATPGEVPQELLPNTMLAPDGAAPQSEAVNDPPARQVLPTLRR